MAAGLETAIESAHAFLDDDRPEPALAALEAVLAHDAHRVGALGAEAMGLAAVASRALGRDAEARAWSDRALSAMGDGDPEGAAEARVLAGLLEDRAELELASRAASTAGSLLRRAITLREAHDEEVGAETWLALAEAEQRAGAIDGALEALVRAEACAEERGDDESMALSREMRADVELERVEPDAAARAYEAAEQGWRAMDDHDGVVRCLVGRARAAERRDDDAAIEAICVALDEMGEDETAARLRAGDVG